MYPVLFFICAVHPVLFCFFHLFSLYIFNPYVCHKYSFLIEDVILFQIGMSSQTHSTSTMKDMLNKYVGTLIMYNYKSFNHDAYQIF